MSNNKKGNRIVIEFNADVDEKTSLKISHHLKQHLKAILEIYEIESGNIKVNGVYDLDDIDKKVEAYFY